MAAGTTNGCDGGNKQTFVFQGQEQSKNKDFYPPLDREDTTLHADQDPNFNKRKEAQGE